MSFKNVEIKIQNFGPIYAFLKNLYGDNLLKPKMVETHNVVFFFPA